MLDNFSCVNEVQFFFEDLNARIVNLKSEFSHLDDEDFETNFSIAFSNQVSNEIQAFSTTHSSGGTVTQDPGCFRALHNSAVQSIETLTISLVFCALTSNGFCAFFATVNWLRAADNAYSNFLDCLCRNYDDC